MKNVDNRKNTAKIKLFCATRWVDRHQVLDEIIPLYEPLLLTLQEMQLKMDGRVKQQTLATVS